MISHHLITIDGTEKFGPLWTFGEGELKRLVLEIKDDTRDKRLQIIMTEFAYDELLNVLKPELEGDKYMKRLKKAQSGQ
jgi:hypothetical protein